MCRHMVKRLAPSLVLALSVTASAGAQGDPITVRAGQVVRLSLRGAAAEPVSGIVLRVTNDSVFLKPRAGAPKGAKGSAFRVGDVARVDVRVGHSSGVGAAIGGALLGLTTVLVIDQQTKRDTVMSDSFCWWDSCSDFTYHQSISRIPDGSYPLAAVTLGGLFYWWRRGDRWAKGMIVTPPMPVTGMRGAPARLGVRWSF